MPYCKMTQVDTYAPDSKVNVWREVKVDTV
jgi:hypothetical protein